MVHGEAISINMWHHLPKKDQYIMVEQKITNTKINEHW
jgi:hypothetical protein